MKLRFWSGFRLTGRGWGLSLTGPALIAIGLLGRYPEIAIVGVAAAAAVLVAIGFVATTPKLIVDRVIDPDRVTRGEPCRVRLRLARRRRGSVSAELVAVDQCGAHMVEAPLQPLRRSRESTVEYDVPTSRRGVVGVGPLRIRRTDPFALISAESRHGATDRVLVYPKVYPMGGVPKGVTRSLDGLNDNVASGTITFDRLRPYVRGDEMRHVHWRTSARLGELMVREHVEQSVPTIVVLLDDRAAGYEHAEAFEEACDAAASLITAAARAELSPRLLTIVAARSGPIMDQLAQVTLEEVETSVGVADLARRAGADTIVLLTGDGRGADEAVATVSALGGPRASVVITQFTSDPSGAVGKLAEESTLDRVLRLRVRTAQEFAAAWHRRHSSHAMVAAPPSAGAAP